MTFIAFPEQELLFLVKGFHREKLSPPLAGDGEFEGPSPELLLLYVSSRDYEGPEISITRYVLNLY